MATKNSIPKNNEVGCMLCKTADGKLSRGPIGVGNATGVQFPETCPPGMQVIGSIHTHPKSGGGSILPSQQDISEAGRIGMQVLCIVTEGKTQCYAVRGLKPK